MGEIEIFAANMPTEPPDGTIDTLFAKGYLSNNALVYRVAWVTNPLTETREKMVRATCTACGETFYLDYAEKKRGTFGFQCHAGMFYSNDECDCPNCGAPVQSMHISRIGYERVIDGTRFTTAANVDGHLVFMLWECEKRVNKNGEILFRTNRIEAQTFIDGQAYRFMGRRKGIGGYTYYNSWHAAKRFKLACEFEHYDELLYLTDALVDTTAEGKSACAVFANSGADDAECMLGEYMRLWQRFPNVENLVRQGYSEYIAGLIRHITNRSGYYYSVSKGFDARKASKFINKNKSKPHEIIGLDKAEFISMRDMDFERIQIYAAAKKKYGVRLTRAQLASAARDGAELCDTLEKGKCFGRRIQPVRLINYLEKAGVRAQYLYDYWGMTQAVCGELPESMMYPKNLKAAHDAMLKRKKEKEDAVLSEKIHARAQKAQRLIFSDAETGLMIRPAESHAELIREGKLLKHCVATYASAVAEGQTLILFVRHISDPDTPYFTLEYKKGTVAQNRGLKNCARTPEVTEFEKKWLEYIKKEGAKNGRKNTNNAKCA